MIIPAVTTTEEGKAHRRTRGKKDKKQKILPISCTCENKEYGEMGNNKKDED